MSQRELSVKSRETTGKEAAKKLRRDGYVPAIAYGHHEEPTKLSVHAKQLRDLLAHGGSHGLIKLQFADGGNELPVIIKALQKHPVTHAVVSADFLHVRLDERVKAVVPIVLEGEPVGVKVDGGILVQALHEIEVEALPQDLPENVVVDVSGLVFNGAPIHVNEVTLPQGVTAVTNGEEAIAVVSRPDAEPTEETPEVAASEVEATEQSNGDEADES